MEVIYDYKALNVQPYPCRDSKWCSRNFKDLQDISVFVFSKWLLLDRS